MDDRRDAGDGDGAEDDQTEWPAYHEDRQPGQAEQDERPDEESPRGSEPGVGWPARERFERCAEGASHVLQRMKCEHPFVQPAGAVPSAAGPWYERPGRARIESGGRSRGSGRSVEDRVARLDASGGSGVSHRPPSGLAACRHGRGADVAGTTRRTGRQLDPVHRDIGGGDELTCCPPVGREAGGPDRGPDRDRAVLLAVVGAALERLDDPVGGVLGGLAVRIGQDDRELVAPVASPDVADARRIDRICSAVQARTRSPNRWPKVSLTSLKSSRSIISSPSGAFERWARTISSPSRSCR